MARYRYVDSPLGTLRLTADDRAIVALDWVAGAASNGDADPLLDIAAEQLAAYFTRDRKTFDLPLMPRGSAHDQSVWREMLTIGYSTTRSYGEIAHAVRSSPRAVGAACGRNPIPVIIPCHRVLAADRRIGGYSGAGGTTTKRRLLVLEGAMLDV